MSHQHRARPSRWRHILGQLGGWTPAEPTSDGGILPVHWYRSDQGLWQDAGVTPAAADGDVVGRWEDITGNADHMGQNTAAKKPTLQLGAGDRLNGHPVVRLDGIDDYLQGAYATGGALAQPFTVFVVARLDAASVDDGVNHKLTDGDDASNRMVQGQNSTTNPDCWHLYAGAHLYGSASNANWNIWCALYNGASSQLWHNGTSVASGDAGSHNPDGLTVGADNSGVLSWDGDYTEIILYDAGLSNAGKNQVGRYLADRYGLGYADI